jgi:hypothetical protein
MILKWKLNLKKSLYENIFIAKKNILDRLAKRHNKAIIRGLEK